MNHELTFGPDEWKLAYRAALEVLHARDQAEDAAQEALLRAYLARDSFAGRARPHSWLYRIAHNTALSQLRRPFVRRYAGDDVDAVVEEASANANAQTPETEASFAQLASSLSTCLAGLRPADRRAFVERFLLGTSERELGAILGVSSNAAKQRAFRARRAVRAQMAAGACSAAR